MVKTLTLFDSSFDTIPVRKSSWPPMGEGNPGSSHNLYLGFSQCKEVALVPQDQAKNWRGWGHQWLWSLTVENWPCTAQWVLDHCSATDPLVTACNPFSNAYILSHLVYPHYLGIISWPLGTWLWWDVLKGLPVDGIFFWCLYMVKNAEKGKGMNTVFLYSRRDKWGKRPSWLSFHRCIKEWIPRMRIELSLPNHLPKAHP